MGAVTTLATALEWSAVTPLWALQDWLRHKTALRFFFLTVHCVAIFMVALLASDATLRGDTAHCGVDFQGFSRWWCELGTLGYALLAVWICWVVVVSRAYTELQPDDFMAVMSRSFSVANFVLLTPLYDKPNVVDKLIRWAMTAMHVVALPIIIFVAMVARSWWAAWKCYTVLALPQGLLDHDYGVCNPRDAIADEGEPWRIFLIGDADPERPVSPDGHEYTYLDPWRGALYLAVHIETFAAALYSIAVFRPQQKSRRVALANWLPATTTTKDE